MRKKTTIWLIVAIILILIGCIIFGGVMTMLNWDFSKLSTDKYVTNEHMISEEYKNISIITGTADIVFVASENATHSITCHEQQNTKHSVSVKDDTLVIELLDTRKWYEYIGIHFGSPKITVSIPAGEYVALSVKGSTGNVDIPEQFRFTTIDITESTGNITNYASASAIQAKTSTGKICLQNVTSQRIVLSVSTGKTILANVKCDSLISHGSTGNIDLKNVQNQIYRHQN